MPRFFPHVASSSTRLFLLANALTVCCIIQRRACVSYPDELPFLTSVDGHAGQPSRHATRGGGRRAPGGGATGQQARGGGLSAGALGRATLCNPALSAHPPLVPADFGWCSPVALMGAPCPRGHAPVLIRLELRMLS